MAERVTPAISAIATAVPGAPHAQRDIAERMIALHGLDARGARRLRGFYRRTRVETRHSVLTHDWTRANDRAFFVPGEPPPSTAARMAVFAREAPELASVAVRALVARTAEGGAPPLDPREVDHLIVVSCTGFMAPGLDVHLTAALGLRADVGRSIIGFQGCHAGLAALRLAADVAGARPAARVLVVCVELSTLHFQHALTKETLLANALFADGAAAVLVDGARVRPTGGARLDVSAVATQLLSEGRDDMRWEVGDEGFTLALSDALPARLRRHTAGVLAAAGLTGAAAPSGATRWAVHPGGAAILDAVAAGLELSLDALDASRAVLAQVGNISSCAVFAVLDRLVATGGVRGGDDVVALAFGPGLTVEVARLGVREGWEEDAWAGRISRHAATTAS